MNTNFVRSFAILCSLALVLHSHPSSGTFVHSANGQEPTEEPNNIGPELGLVTPTSFESSEFEYDEPDTSFCPDCGNSDCAGHAGLGQCYWGSAEYLLVWSKGGDLPVLASTSPATPLADVGVLPAATVVFGGERVDSGERSGARITLGKWIDEDQLTGWGLRFMAVEGSEYGFNSATDGAGLTVLARPYFDVSAAAEAAQLVEVPAIASGNLDIRGSVDVAGGEAFWRRCMYHEYGNRIDLIGGYQYSRVDEELNISNQVTSLDAGFLGGIGSGLDAFDLFDVKNEFHGGEIGLMIELEDGPLTWKILGKVGMGNMRQILTVQGQSTSIPAMGASTTTAGGLLSMPSNIGTFTNDEFAVLPEGGINLSYSLSQNVDVSLGYTFMYWSKVLRAGDQIDRNLNLTQATGGTLVGPALPAVTLQDTEFWVQGLSFSIEWRY